LADGLRRGGKSWWNKEKMADQSRNTRRRRTFSDTRCTTRDHASAFPSLALPQTIYPCWSVKLLFLINEKVVEKQPAVAHFGLSHASIRRCLRLNNFLMSFKLHNYGYRQSDQASLKHTAKAKLYLSHRLAVISLPRGKNEPLWIRPTRMEEAPPARSAQDSPSHCHPSLRERSYTRGNVDKIISRASAKQIDSQTELVIDGDPLALVQLRRAPPSCNRFSTVVSRCPSPGNQPRPSCP
jgi:hypothetical protein